MERTHRDYSKGSPNMIKRLTPYHILEKLTSQRKKEMNFLGSRSKMTGQQLYQRIHTNFRREEPIFLRALLGHSGKNLDTSTFSHRKIVKAHHCCIVSDSQDTKIQKKSGGLGPGGLGRSTSRKSVYFSLVSPLDPPRLTCTSRTIMTASL